MKRLAKLFPFKRYRETIDHQRRLINSLRRQREDYYYNARMWQDKHDDLLDRQKNQFAISEDKYIKQIEHLKDMLAESNSMIEIRDQIIKNRGK